MTLTLTPDTEARLLALAAERGLAPEETINVLLTQAETNPTRSEFTASEERQILTALQTSVEDYAAGRWISLEDYEAQVQAERMTRDVKELHQ